MSCARHTLEHSSGCLVCVTVTTALQHDTLLQCTWQALLSIYLLMWTSHQ